MRVLGLVTARGGSKGIPGKNRRQLAGKPLLEYTAEAALAAMRLARVVLSTDDSEIAELGRRCGLDVPFLRPEELARDDTPTLPVVQHAIRELEDLGESFDAICLLQPTTPFRRPQHIDGCINLLEQHHADSVITVLAVPPKYNPHWVYFRDDTGALRLSTGEAVPIPRRQDLPPAYHREGSVYVTRRDVLIAQNSLYGTRVLGFVLDGDESVNIDSMADWERAEQMLQLNFAGAKHCTARRAARDPAETATARRGSPDAETATARRGSPDAETATARRGSPDPAETADQRSPRIL